jgi:hypothetical protein
MSVTGIASNLASYLTQTLNTQSTSKQFQQDFQKLGQDLQAGNLTAAQTDLSALQKLQTSGTAAGTSTTNSMVQTLQALGADLQAGDLKDAQQLYSSVAQKFQAHHGHHMHHEGGEFSQDMNQLGQALQSGNLTAAQAAYGTLQQDFQQFALSGVSNTASTAADTVSVQA